VPNLDNLSETVDVYSNLLYESIPQSVIYLLGGLLLLTSV